MRSETAGFTPGTTNSTKHTLVVFDSGLFAPLCEKFDFIHKTGNIHNMLPARWTNRQAHGHAYDQAPYELHTRIYPILVFLGTSGEQSSPKWEIPCPGRRSTTVQNLTPLGLSSVEKSVTIQTNKKKQSYKQ